MPYTKSTPTLQNMCFQAVVKNFKNLQNEIANLPPILINELYTRRHELHLNIRPLPSNLFIHSGTRKLDGPFDFDLPKSRFIYNITNVCKFEVISSEIICLMVTDKESQNLTHLKLCGWNSISPDHFDNLIENIPTIVHLNLQSTQCTDSVLSKIGIHCKRLQHLNISCCRRISDIGIHALCVDTNMTINHLEMELTSVTTRGCLTALQNLPFLQQFETSEFHKLLKSEEFNSIDDCSSSSNWQANCLESLPGYLKTRQNLKTALTRCPNLRQILVTATNDGLDQLSQFQRLETIVIHRHNAPRSDFNDTIEPALRNARNLRIKHLTLFHIDLVDVEVIGHLFPALEKLKLSDVSFSDHVLEKKRFLGVQFQHVRKLDLDFTDAHVPKRVLRMLLSNCLSLESLLVANCDALTGELVADVVRANPLKNLEMINLKRCAGITGWALMLLMEMENPLRFVSICRCKNITLFEYGVLEKFVRTRHLNVSVSYFR